MTDDPRFPALSDSVPLPQDGGEARRIHEFYRQVLDSLPVQLAVFDPDLRYEYATPSAFRTADVRNWVIGKSDVEYGRLRNLPPEVVAQRRETVRRVFDTGETVEFEEGFTTKDGEARFFKRFVAPAFDNEGRVQHVLGYGIDITDLKRVEAELRDAKQQAERLGQAKERFLANMSHELRTPLNAVVGTAFLLDGTALDAEQREYVSTIRAAAETLLSLINDVLDFTKIGAGAISFEQIPFDVRDVMTGVIGAVKVPGSAKGLRIRGSAELDVPVRVLGDPTRLKQVLLNLVGNAIKFTEKGEVSIEARMAHERSGGPSWLEIEVRDTGIGIGPDKIDHIFDAFTQEREDTTRRFGGSGLGLSIVRELVSRQGGTVSASSVPGEGSRFVVRLPCAPVADPPPVPVEAPDTGIEGLRVLLVEDNDVNRALATRLLERAGAAVVLATNGLEAVDRLREDRAFDVVLMDIQMPVMDGFEASRRIRIELDIPLERLPILALTASALVEHRGRALEVGMNDFVMKPFDPLQLFQRIRAHVGREPSV
ncbi:MAG: ATP-binding protein [Vicinamibacterales bacterium]